MVNYNPSICLFSLSFVGIWIGAYVFVICVIIFRILEDVVETCSDDLAHAVPINCVVPMLIEVYAPVETFFSHVVNGTKIVSKIIQQFLPTSGSISVDA